MPDRPSAASAKPLLIAFTLLAGIILLIGLGGAVHTAQREKQLFADRLQGVADLKVAQIVAWLFERRGDTEVLRHLLADSREFFRWQERDDQSSRQPVIQRLGTVQRYYGYDNALIVDEQARPLLATADRPLPVSPALVQAVQRVLAGGSVEHTDLYAVEDGAGRHIRLDLVGAIPQPAGRPRMAVVLRVDPGRFLYPLIQSGPLPGASAETLLVRQAGDQLVYLNEPRHRTPSPLRLLVPHAQPEALAMQAIAAPGRMISATDYRGTPVTGLARAVPGTAWYMVAKLDTTEIDQPVRQAAGWVMLADGLVLVVAAVVLYLLYQRRELQSAQEVHQAETEKLKIFRLLNSILAGTPDAIFAKDIQGRYLLVSPGADLLSGRPPASMLGQDDYGVFPPAVAAAIQAQDRAVMASCALASFEETLPIANDDSRTFLTTKGPLLDTDGKLLGVFGIARDITSRKAAECALEESNKRYRSLFHNMLEGFALCEVRYEGEQAVDFRYVEINPAFERITGVGDAAGKWASELFPGLRESNPEVFEIYGRVASNGQPERFETYVPALGIWFAVNAYSPEPGYFVAVFDNITERKTVQQALEEHNARLEAEVAARTVELETANRELQAFTYAASHDLKAPLRGINSFAGLLERDYRNRLEGDGLMFLDHIRRYATRMANLIDDLLAYARVEQQGDAIQAVDIGGAAQAIVVERQNDIHQRGALVQVDVPAGAVQANPGGLAQVLRNLLDNALKYARPDAQPIIHIGGEADGATYRLWVRDNGIGFDMAYRERIFEIFQRLHAYNEYQGTGIGLALVKKAMERMGGKVWAESAPGAGATFFLEFQV